MVDLPNADRLKQLPLRALVAYAVRCAMRVQLLYLKWQDGQAQAGSLAGMAESVAEAIELASKYASEQGEYDFERGQKLEETVIQAVIRAKDTHRGAAFAANSAYAALNAANLASRVPEKGSRHDAAEKVVLAVITAADAAVAAHQAVGQSALDDWHTMQLMRFGQYPDHGRPVDPSPEGKLGPLSNKKPAPVGWKDQSATLRQVKKNENVLDQTREELRFQQEERKKDKAAHEAKCDEYEKTIRHLKAEVIPLKRERDELAKQCEALQAALAEQDQLHKTRLTDLANQLLVWANPLPKEPPAKQAPAEPSVPQESSESSESEPPESSEHAESSGPPDSSESESPTSPKPEPVTC